MADSKGSKTPDSFADGINTAMQSIAAAMSAPDADLQFGTAMIHVMGTFLKEKNQPHGSPGAGSPSGGGAGPGAAPGASVPGGPAGGGAQNPQMPNLSAPAGPSEPGSGPTPGLTPNPDDMRRVMQEVAGQ